MGDGGHLYGGRPLVQAHLIQTGEAYMASGLSFQEWSLTVQIYHNMLFL